MLFLLNLFRGCFHKFELGDAPILRCWQANVTNNGIPDVIKKNVCKISFCHYFENVTSAFLRHTHKKRKRGVTVPIYIALPPANTGTSPVITTKKKKKKEILVVVWFPRRAPGRIRISFLPHDNGCAFMITQGKR